MKNWWIRLGAVFFGGLAIWLAVGAVVTALVGEGYSFPGHVMRAVSIFVLVGVMLVIVFRLEKPVPEHYGFRPRPGWFGIGALAYALPFAIAGLLIAGLGAASLTVTSGVGELVAKAALVLVLVLLYEAIPEELIFRGYLFTVLRERLPAWLTVIAQAALFCLFGLLIGAAVDPTRLLLFALFSLTLGVIRSLSGTVFATIGFHATFQLITQLSTTTWGVIEIVDPELWFRDVAFVLAPFILGIVIVAVAARMARRRALSAA